MAVVITPYHRPSPVSRPAPAAARPPLQLIPGGRRAARSRSRQLRAHLAAGPRAVHPGVYRRRRLGAVLVGGVVVVVAYLAVLGAATMVGGHPGAAAPSRSQASAGAAGAPAAAMPVTYVVKPGDTLWSIARRLRPSGDIRGVVDELANRAGSGSVQAGQRLSLDGLVA